MDDRYARADLSKRLDPALLEQFASIPTTVISDALVGFGIAAHVVRDVRRVSGSSSSTLVGSAVTIRYAPIDAPHPPHEAPYLASRIIERASPRDVLVLAAAGAPYAFWGDHMTSHAQRRSVAMAVVDGGARDISRIRALDFPLYARGTTPETLLPHFEAVAYNEAVTCGGVEVEPGDVIAADEDGVVVVPLEIAAAVLETARARRELEEEAETSGDVEDPFAVYDRIYRDGWAKGS